MITIQCRVGWQNDNERRKAVTTDGSQLRTLVAASVAMRLIVNDSLAVAHQTLSSAQTSKESHKKKLA